MNLNHFYYRGYYDGLDFQKIIDGRAKTDKAVGDFFAKKNRILLAYEAPESAVDLHAPTITGLDQLPNYCALLLQTSGQGLLCGTGYSHETGSIGEVKLGFYFDPISGLPTLPGHSVKGALRAVFPEDAKKEMEGIRHAKAKWIANVLRQKNIPIPENTELGFAENLKCAVFEGLKDIPLIKHDIFLEAAIAKPGKFLGRDALAPHDRKTDGLKNPIPIPFIKVLPGVIFRFSFILQDSIIDGIEVSRDAKLFLFETILTTFGMGAKTRGGYGVFEKPKINVTATKPKAEASVLAGIESKLYKSLPLRSDEVYEAVINGKNDKGKIRFLILAGEPGKGYPFTQKWPEELPDGTVIKVKITLNINGQIQELIKIS